MMAGMRSRGVDQEAVRKTRPRDQPMTFEDLPVMTCSCHLRAMPRTGEQSKQEPGRAETISQSEANRFSSRKLGSRT